MATWFGLKATSGLCQAIIAAMPPHALYVESHLGGGEILKRKPPGLRNIGIDLNRRMIDGFRCGHRFLAGFPFEGDELVYSDPPYVQSSRKS